MAEVFSVNELENKVMTSIGEIKYDYLVLAMGTTNNYFNFDEVKDKMQALKSMTDALRSFIMQNLERSLVVENTRDQEEVVNIAIRIGFVLF